MKHCYSVLCFLLLSFAVSAQQNAPVAGQAAALFDLLRKDYNSIDPDLRGDEIIKDRALVISIFRSFENGNFPTPKNKAKLDKALKNVNESYTLYNQTKKMSNAAASIPINTTQIDVVNTMNDKSDDRIDAIYKTRSAYDSVRYLADNEQLIALSEQFAADSNLFLKDMIDSYFIKKYEAIENTQIDIFATVNLNASIQKGLPFLGGALDLSSSTIINALGAVIAKRIKEELMIFATENIKQWIEGHKKTPPVEELLVLLPTTSSYLLNFEGDRIANFPNELKQYIQADLNKLLEHSYELRNTTYFKKLTDAYPSLKLGFEALHFIPDLGKVKYPADYFSILGSSELVRQMKYSSNNATMNIGYSISFLEMISNSLMMLENGEPKYTTVDFWKNYGHEVPFMKMYLGFMLQQDLKYYHIKFKPGGQPFTLDKSLIALMNASTPIVDMIDNLEPILSNICQNAEKVYQGAQTIKKLDNSGVTIGVDTIYTFAKSVIDFSKDLSKDADLLMAMFNQNKNTTVGISEKIKPYITMAESSNEAIRNIRNKQYAQGISQLLNLGATLASIVTDNEHIEFAPFIALSNLKMPAGIDWSKLNELKLSPNNIQESTVAFAHNLGTELSSINSFYANQNGRSESVKNNFDAAIKVLDSIKKGDVLKPEEINLLNTLISNDAYGRVIVSYYSGIMLDEAGAALRDKMRALKVTIKCDTCGHDKKDIIVNVFRDTFVNNVTTHLDDYIIAIYTQKLLKLNTGADHEAALDLAKKNILNDVQMYLDSLPKSFGWTIDSKTLRIIHFVNDMALAQTSDDVEKAIDDLAEPAGSYSVKQNSYYTISISSFPGFIGGAEFTQDYSTVTSVGFTAPVGLNVTFGQVLGKWSLGAFIPVIDIGAVTRLRINSDSNTETMPEITWKNVFAPGFFLCVGPYKTPFSFNFGIQYGPEVKEISTGINKSSFRVAAAVTIDLSLLHLYGRPRP